MNSKTVLAIISGEEISLREIIDRTGSRARLLRSKPNFHLALAV